MKIQVRPGGDRVANLYMGDAYMRWALLAAEEVVGKQGLAVVLREAKLERFIDNYPPEELRITGTITQGEYARLCGGLLTFFGRAGKSMVIRVGRLSSKYAIEKQGDVFNVAAKVTAKLLPYPAQIKMSLDNMQSGFRKMYAEAGQHIDLRVEDRGEHWAYVAGDCPLCAGLQSDSAMCWSWIGVLKEGASWLTGKEFDVEEVECRAAGGQACVWEIGKKPRE